MHLSHLRRRLLAASLTVLLLLYAAALPAYAVHQDVGYRDFSFNAQGVSAPTGEKPQSKLWFHGGYWWGALFSVSLDAYTVHRLDRASERWEDTRVVVDPRNTARIDVLKHGSKVYVASAGTSQTSSGSSGEFRRFTYDPGAGRYRRDAGFPVRVTNGGMEALVLARESTGRLWVAYTQSGRVMLARSMADHTRWTAPFQLSAPGADPIATDDIASVIAFGGRIGVMWSNQLTESFHFAVHDDESAPTGGWRSETAFAGAEVADDHLNMKHFEGRIYVAAKTSMDGSRDPLVVLLVRDTDGVWTLHRYGTVADQHTRPIVLIDATARALYLFASAGSCCNGGVVYYKRTRLDAISFPEGLGTAAIRSSEDPNVNNVTSTKQNLTSSTGMVVMAADYSTRTYLHNSYDLSGLASAGS